MHSWGRCAFFVKARLPMSEEAIWLDQGTSRREALLWAASDKRCRIFWWRSARDGFAVGLGRFRSRKLFLVQPCGEIAEYLEIKDGLSNLPDGVFAGLLSWMLVRNISGNWRGIQWKDVTLIYPAVHYSWRCGIAMRSKVVRCVKTGNYCRRLSFGGVFFFHSTIPWAFESRKLP